MGVLRFFRTHLGIDLGGAGEDVRDFAMTEAQKAVAVLKTTELGSTVAAIIADVTTRKNADGSDMSSVQKFEAALADALPEAVKFLTVKGAVGVAAGDVESIARELIQSTFNDTKSTKAGALATQILALFGVSS